MPELNYEMKNLDSMWTRIAASNKIEIVCAVLEDRIEELKPHFHNHKKPFNSTPAA